MLRLKKRVVFLCASLFLLSNTTNAMHRRSTTIHTMYGGAQPGRRVITLLGNTGYQIAHETVIAGMFIARGFGAAWTYLTGTETNTLEEQPATTFATEPETTFVTEPETTVVTEPATATQKPKKKRSKKKNKGTLPHPVSAPTLGEAAPTLGEAAPDAEYPSMPNAYSDPGLTTVTASAADTDDDADADAETGWEVVAPVKKHPLTDKEIKAREIAERAEEKAAVLAAAQEAGRRSNFVTEAHATMRMETRYISRSDIKTVLRFGTLVRTYKGYHFELEISGRHLVVPIMIKRGEVIIKTVFDKNSGDTDF